MRKNLLFIGLALSMLAVGCNNGPEEEPKKPSTGKNKVTVTANATLPEGLTWAEGDVYLVNGVEAPALGAEANGAQTVALTVTNPSETSPVLVLGPAALRTGLNEITIGDVQQYVSGGYDRSVRVLAGVAAESLPAQEGNKNDLVADVDLAFVQGVLTLPLTLEEGYTGEEPVAVESVALSTLNEEALCGVYTVSVSTVNDVIVPTIKAGETSSSVDLVCAEPVVLGAEAVDFNFVLPVGKYKGFQFVVTDTEDRKYVFSVESEVVIGVDATVLESVAYKVVDKAPATLNITIAESGIKWLDKDAVVCNNELSSEVAAEAVGTSSASFDFQAIAYPYSVFYPADLYAQVGTIRFRTDQPLVQDGYDRASLAMVGYSSTTDVTLTNLCGVMVLPVTNNFDADAITIKGIKLTSVGGEPLSGKYRINYLNGTISPVSVHDTLELVAPEDAPVVLQPGESTNVGIVVPAGKFAQGLVVDILSNIVTDPVTVSATGVEVRSGEESSLEAYVYAEVKIESINTPELLMEFAKNVNGGRYKKFVNENGEVLLGADIDMSGIADEDWAAIGTSEKPFDGIFNGQGHSIKNWKTTKSLFGYNAGTVKNVVIASSCEYTDVYEGTVNCGLVVSYNQSSGLVENCENNAPIKSTDVSKGEHRVGGVCGASYGTMKNCVNNGEISITSQKVANNMYIGGVVGYINTNASGKEALGTEFLVGCTNTASVTVNFPCQPKNAYVGGVLGSTQAAKAAEAVYQGVITGCKNTGDVLYHFDVLSSGTYANVGGVVGYSQADIIGCENEGAVTYTVPLSDLSVNGTRPAAGGVVACTMYSLKDCTNKGAVTVSGIWAAGTSGAAGAGGSHQILFGGVAAVVGNTAYKADYEATNCNNYGKVNVVAYGKTGGASQAYVAGVIAKATVPVANCHNYGELNLGTFAGESYLAGVIGHTNGTITNCTNNAKSVLKLIGISDTTKSVYLGGVVGRASAYPLTECVTNGPVQIEVDENSASPATLYTGGVAGYADISISDCVLNAPYSLTTYALSTSLRGAGVVGQVKTVSGYTITNCSTTEKASVTITTKNKKANYIAGVIGCGNNGVKDCTNRANVNVTITEALTSTDITYIGGVAGAQKEDMTGSYNYGNITADMCQSTAPLYVGGLLGRNNAATATLSDGTNSGNITITNAGYVSNINGLVGSCVDGATVADVCTSTGVITVNGAVQGADTPELPVE